jgi:hypothetical protein
MIDIEKLKEKDLVKLHEQLKEKKESTGLTDKELEQYEQIKDILWMEYRI